MFESRCRKPVVYQAELVFALLLVDGAELPACSHASESRVGLDGQVVCRYVLYAQTEQALDVGFDPFVMLAQNLRTVLQMIERNVNVLFNEKFTTIYNAKVSQLAVFRIVEQAQIFSNYAVYLFDGVLYEIVVNEGVHELNQPKPYRYEFINKYKAGVVELLKIGSLPNGANMLITEIDNLRKSLDTTLLDDRDQVNSAIKTVKNKFGLIEGGATILASIFRYFGEWGVLMRNLKYQKMIQEKEWLQNHSDLLKLQLNGVDPNSDEYRKAVKIINTYNDMIRDLDLKISSYMED